MTHKILGLGLAAAIGLAGIVLPQAAEGRPVRLTTTLKAYGGNGAYLAIYLIDPQGRFHSTLRVAGGKAKYHRHLTGWFRGSNGRIDGTTGASVGSGQTLRISVDIADALIDAGYQIQIDSAVENERDVPADVTVPLAAGNAGRAIAGRGYVQSFAFDM